LVDASAQEGEVLTSGLVLVAVLENTVDTALPLTCLLASSPRKNRERRDGRNAGDPLSPFFTGRG
jgi:hypothetical protein